MKQSLIKIFNENDVDVSLLNEANIAEYVRTKQTLNTINKTIIEPFKEVVKKKGNGVFYDANNFIMENKIEMKDKKHSAKEVIDLLSGTLDSMLIHNNNDRNSFGVKRFGGIVAVDANYVQELFDIFTEQVTGKEEKYFLSKRGKGKEELALKNKGELVLALQSYRNLFESKTKPYNVQARDIMLYLAADHEVKKLKDLIVSPFEKKFKEQANKSKEKTIIDTKTYGGLAVQVKTTPRYEADSNKAKQVIEEIVNLYANTSEQSCDNLHVFYNKAINEPKPYVSINKLIIDIKKASAKTELREKQEINILYKPSEAIILSE